MIQARPSVRVALLALAASIASSCVGTGSIIGNPWDAQASSTIDASAPGFDAAEVDSGAADASAVDAGGADAAAPAEDAGSDPADASGQAPDACVTTTDVCGDGIDQDCSGADESCPSCAEGAVTQRCACGGAVRTSGHCCANAWQSSACDSCPGGNCTGFETCGSCASEGGACAQADCATQPLRTSGTVYYYCDCQSGADPQCVAGDDANAGTSPSAPRRTFANARVRFQAMAAGDTVALCRGGRWTEDGGSFNNPSCTAANTCDFRDYVPAWGSLATSRPQLRVTPGPDLFLITSGGGYRIWNIDTEVIGTPTSETMVRIYGSAHDIDVCNVRIFNSRTGFLTSGDQTSVAGVRLRGSQICNSNFSGYFGGSSGLVIDGNYFENNGLGGTPQQHTMYLISHTPVGWQPMVVKNNEIVTNGNATWNNTQNACNGVMLVIHGQNTGGIIVENNKIVSTSSAGNCWAVQAASSNEQAANASIAVRRNRLAGPHTRIELKCCVDCSATDNIVAQTTSAFSAINLGAADDSGGAGCSAGYQTTNATIQNNSVYRTSIQLGSNGTSHVVENNAVWTDDASCFSVGSNTERYANNHCRSSGGGAESTLWVDAAHGDFTPLDPGPLIGAANQTYYSPFAIGTAAWDPADPGAIRTPPVDIGAMSH